MLLLSNRSQGAMKALFCQHEGYFGAVGCLLELMKTHRSQPPSPHASHKLKNCDEKHSDNTNCDEKTSGNTNCDEKHTGNANCSEDDEEEENGDK